MSGKRSFKYPDDPFYNLDNVASATEATGLIPSITRSDDGTDTIAGLYSIHKQKKLRGKRKQ